MQFIPTLQDLSDHVAVHDDYISAPVAAVDKIIMSRRPTSQKYLTKETPPNTAHATTDIKQKDKSEDIEDNKAVLVENDKSEDSKVVPVENGDGKDDSLN